MIGVDKSNYSPQNNLNIMGETEYSNEFYVEI